MKNSYINSNSNSRSLLYRLQGVSHLAKTLNSRGLVHAIALTVVMLFSSVAWSATITWTNNGGAGNSRWTTATNWTGGVPADGDDIVIPIAATITRVPNRIINSLSVTADVSLVANGTARTLTVTNASGATSLYVATGKTLTFGDGSGGNAVSLTNTSFGVTSNVAGNIAMTANTTLAIQTTTLNITGNISGAGAITMSSGTLNISGAFSNTGTFTCGTGIVNFNGAAQSIRATTYNNLTLSGSGAKTFPAGTTTVNGILSMEETATTTLTGTLTYGTASTLQYKGSALQTTGSEFPTTFSGTGGVIISNTNGVNMSGNHTIDNALTLTVGSFSIGANTLTLNGTIPTCGSLIGGATSNLTISGTAANTNLPNIALNNLTLNRANGATLCGNINVNNILTLTNGNLSLGNYDLTLGTAASISGTPSGTKMIETNGTGSLIKQSTTTAGLNMTYPVGSGSLYNPMILTTTTGTIAGTATVAVRAVAGLAPNASTTDLKKHWIVSSSNITLTSTNLSFAYVNPTDIGGTQNEYMLRYSTTPAVTWIAPNNPSLAGVNPMTTTGTTIIDGTWTACEVNQTWYSLRSGNWNDPSVWTLDPAGSLINNPTNSYPQLASDNIVVKNGKTILMNLSGLTCKNLTVEGSLDFASTSGHTFTSINGNGRILLSSNNWPAGDATNFITAGLGEGTTVFYGNSFSLTTGRTFYNMEVMMTAGQILTLMSDFTLNNNLEVKTGVFKINNDAATSIRTLIVKGNVDIALGASITTGLGKTNGAYSIPATMPASGSYHTIYHKLEIWGDFTNNGTVRFTNQATNAPVYNQFTNTGAVSVWFKGLTNNTATCNGTTDLYNLIIDKGTDQTYTLELNASSTANFALYGPNSVGRNENAPYSTLNPEIRKALWIYNGTLKLTGDINIPTLSEGSDVSGNGDYAIGGNACLWIASNNVSVYSTADNASQAPASASGINTGTSNQALSIYGKYRISAGSLATRSSAGLIFWSTANAVVSIEGGTTTVAQFRSAASGAGQTSYLQSGGILKVDGVGEVTNGFPLFGFDSPDGVFVMSAGEIQVLAESGNTNDIYVPIADGNYNTTGGQLTISVNGNTTVDFNSNVPFYNVDISRLNTANTAVLSLKTDLKVLGNLTLGNNSTLTSNNFNVSIGKNFTTGATASTYTTGTNTTTFNGAQNSIITNAANLSLNKVVINKSAHPTAGSFYEVSSSGSAPLSIASDLTVTLGAFNTGSTSPNVAGNIAITNGQITSTVAGVASTGKIVLNGSTAQNLSGSGLNFGSFTLNNGNNGISLLSDVIIKDLTFSTAGSAKVNMEVYNMRLTGSITNTDPANRWIYGAGNASDGGLSLYISANGTKTYPIGVSTKYTPAVMTVSGYSDDGYATVIPVNASLLTTNPAGGILLPYYWKTNNSGFSVLPSVIYSFTYAEADNTGYYPGKVLDVSPYTRSYVNDVAKVDEAANAINFDTPFTLEKANYTAGATNRFTGTVVNYYSKGGDWAVPATWNRDTKTSGITGVPAAGSIVHIYCDATPLSGRVNFYAAIANAPAEIIFEHDYTTYPIPNSETVPRLQFHLGTTTYNLGRVTGTGMISIGATGVAFNADFGDFGTNTDSYYMYFGGPATNLSGIPTPIPNLMFEYTTTINQTLTVNADFIVQGGATVSPLQNIDIKRDLAVGMWTGGTFQFQEATPAVTISVGRNIDFTNNPSGTLGARTIICQSGTSTNVAHRLIVKGNIIHGSDNGSVFDLYNGSTTRNRVVLELTETGIHNYSRTSTAVPDFYQIVMNKGIDQTNSFTFNQHFTVYTGANNGATKSIAMQNGTLILNNSNFSAFNFTSGGANFAIPQTSALELKAGTYTASGTSGIDLDGKLKINGATASLDMSGNDNPIVFGAGGSATIDVTAGTLIIGGQIRRGTNSDVGVLKYYQSGGNVFVGRTITSATTRGTFEIMGVGSILNITGGDLYIERAASTTLPGLYLMPETTNLSANNTIHIGSAVVGSQTIGIYSTPTLQNLDILNSSTAKQMTVPLTLSGNLSISSGSFNTNGLALNIGGNFVNNATFTHGNNTTTFNGSIAQAISGTTPTTFYNLSKTTSNTLTTNAATSIANDLTISMGTVADNGNTISVKGDFTIDGTHQYGGSGKGILMDNASTAQNIRGNGTIGMLTINNTKGVNVPIGNILAISNNLRLEAGVFDIDKNLLSLGVNAVITPGNPFSATNMIQTNVSFTDNGVKKVFQSGASGTFIYPVGSVGKYTPVTFNITGNANSTGSIIIKPAAEYHPSALDNTNVLAYYWTVMSSGISGFSASATLKYNPADVKVTGTNTEADYIAARLLSNGLGVWNKFDETAVDETNHQILFTYTAVGDAEISGDYTAGINSAIPDKVQRFESTKDGNWNDVSVWCLIDPNTNIPGTAGVGIPTGGPRGSIATVKHVVTTTVNGISSYNTIISGLTSNLIIGSTYGHRLGIVSGNGILTSSVGDLPAADYSQLFASTGGTLEYNGSSSIDILTDLPIINSLKLSGTGTRTLPNINFQLLGNLTIAGPIVNNDTYDKTISVKGNVTFDSGAFSAGNLTTSKFIMNGSAVQTIGGLSSFTSTNDLYHFEISNSAGVVLAKPLDISGNLTLTSGTITSTASNILKMTTSSSSASAGSNNSFVNGPLIKQITSGGSFSFPVGNSLRFGSLYLENVSASGLWRAQYFDNSPDVASLTTSSFQAPVKYVSTNEYWNLIAPAAATATATLRWDGASGVNPADSGLRGVKWITDKWYEVTLSSLTGDASSGTGKTASAISFNDNAGGNYITFGAITLSAYTWTGAVDTDWFNTGNWSTSIVPSASSNTTIANTTNKPVIQGTTVAQTNAVTINTGATLTLAPASKMTIGGNLTNAGTIIIQNTVSSVYPNPAATMASLITNGTANTLGTTTTQTTMPLGTRYWYYGFSVNGTGVTSTIWNAADAVNTFAYKYQTAAYSRFTSNGIALLNNPSTGVLSGYAVKLLGTGTSQLNATGTINNGNYVENNVRADDWSLICNPYPSSMDMLVNYTNNPTDYVTGGGKLDATIWVTTNAAGAVKYATYNFVTGVGQNGGTKTLPPMQAFWMANRTLTAGTLNISQAARVHAAVALKSLSTASEDENIFRLEAKNSYNIFDEVVVTFNAIGNTSYSNNDALKKMGSGTNALSFYSLKDNKSIAINVMPLFSTDISIPLGYSTSTAGEVVIHPSNLGTFDSNIDVWLEDKATGEMINLRQTGDVTISATAGNSTDRLVLHFKPTENGTATLIIPAITKHASEIDIAQINNQAIVNINTEASINAKIEIINEEGSLVTVVKTKQKETKVTLPNSHKIYIIRVTNGLNIKTAKVISQGDR